MKVTMIRRLCLVSAGILLMTLVNDWALADITLPKIFSDHMVLQQNANVRIWGTAPPEKSLVIRFDGSERTVAVDAEGSWFTEIRTGPAGGPYEIEISELASETSVLLNNVLVGEVWICSGQSNMAWPLENSDGGEREIELAKEYSNIRLFSVGRNPSSAPMSDFVSAGPWSVASPETVPEFSAVGWHFGRELSRRLGGIPIGLINSSFGGTPVEAWMGARSLQSTPDFEPLLAHWESNPAPGAKARPGCLFNGMIAPITRFNVRGSIWYQGEANVGRAAQYTKLFPALINGWRESFSNSEMPFYFVQLAPYSYTDRPAYALPELWDAQLKTLRNVDQTGMVVTTDIGNLKNIHPANKQDVGKRLALWALANTYADPSQDSASPALFSGPLYDSFSVDGDSLTIQFQYVGKSLISTGDEELTGFTVAGADGNFMPAVAEIVDGVAVRLSSPEVSEPTAARYCWDEPYQPSLANDAGLPASPFRTDDLPLESFGRSY